MEQDQIQIYIHILLVTGKIVGIMLKIYTYIQNTLSTGTNTLIHLF